MREKNPKKVAAGKRSRVQGKAFELRARKDLEETGWTVDRWSNNVDLEKNQIIAAKAKWAGPNRPMMLGAGFPDFIAFKKQTEDWYEVIGVECKVGKYLDKIEKEKCKWLLDNQVFSKIMIAYKTKEKNRIIVNYQEFK